MGKLKPAIFSESTFSASNSNMHTIFNMSVIYVQSFEKI